MIEDLTTFYFCELLNRFNTIEMAHLNFHFEQFKKFFSQFFHSLLVDIPLNIVHDNPNTPSRYSPPGSQKSILFSLFNDEAPIPAIQGSLEIMLWKKAKYFWDVSVTLPISLKCVPMNGKAKEFVEKTTEIIDKSELLHFEQWKFTNSRLVSLKDFISQLRALALEFCASKISVIWEHFLDIVQFRDEVNWFFRAVDNPLQSDVKILCSGKEFFAHKIVLKQYVIFYLQFLAELQTSSN
jgi:hypothetical protein